MPDITAEQRLAKVYTEGLVAPYTGKPHLGDTGTGITLLTLGPSSTLVAFSSLAEMKACLGDATRGVRLSIDEVRQATADRESWVIDPHRESNIVLDAVLLDLMRA
jgi:hypothetical protein